MDVETRTAYALADEILDLRERMVRSLLSEIFDLIESKPEWVQGVAVTALRRAEKKLFERWRCRLDWGVCPECRQTDGVVNLRSAHFGICAKHKYFWLIGSNLFPDWQIENEAIWERNRQLLAGYREVEAVEDMTRTTYDEPTAPAGPNQPRS